MSHNTHNAQHHTQFINAEKRRTPLRFQRAAIWLAPSRRKWPGRRGAGKGGENSAGRSHSHAHRQRTAQPRKRKVDRARTRINAISPQTSTRPHCKRAQTTATESAGSTSMAPPHKQPLPRPRPVSGLRVWLRMSGGAVQTPGRRLRKSNPRPPRWHGCQAAAAVRKHGGCARTQANVPPVRRATKPWHSCEGRPVRQGPLSTRSEGARASVCGNTMRW